MDYNHPIMITSVNMCKRNAVTHALLNSDRFTNIFLIRNHGMIPSALQEKTHLIKA